MRGKFIVFEGPDGSGTTFHSEKLAERLRKEGGNVILTREPTEGEIGRKVRRVLTEGMYSDPSDLQKMFCDDRAEHVERVIRPAIEAGKIVISDRYIPSTLIYGEMTHVPKLSLQRWNEGFPKPDLTLILLPPFEVSLKRLQRRASSDPFEKEQFQKYVYEGYKKYAKDHPDAVVIDTSGSKEEVGEGIWRKVQDVM
ncbi:MAG TPA: dTMP kinase [Candidatus Peribacterales bacterium]|nr:dTMP kinase [Candidatus Peribacterales bacterium]